MLEQLEEWLSGIVAPARKDQLIRAFKALHIQNGDVVEDAIDRLLNTVGKLAETDAVSYLERDVFDLLDKAISVYGVTVNRENLEVQDIDKLVAILETLQQIPDYEDYRALETIFEMAGDSVEIFSELVELVTEVKASVIMVYIERVADSLILRIRKVVQPKIELFNAKLEEEEIRLSDKTREELTERRNAMMKFIDQVSVGDEERRKVMRTIAGRFASYPPEQLFDKCYNTIQNAKNMSVNQQANMWCLVIHLMQFLDVQIGVTDNDRYEELKVFLNKAYDDPNFLFSLSTRIDTLMKVFQEGLADGTS